MSESFQSSDRIAIPMADVMECELSEFNAYYLDHTPQHDQPPAKKPFNFRNVTGTPEGGDLEIIGAGPASAHKARLTRLQFPRDATSEEIHEAIQKLRREAGHVDEPLADTSQLIGPKSESVQMTPYTPPDHPSLSDLATEQRDGSAAISGAIVANVAVGGW